MIAGQSGGQIIAIAWLVLGAGVVGLAVHGIKQGAAWLVAREQSITNPKVRQALEWATGELASAAQTVVVGLNNTVTAALKQSGTWNSATARAVKVQATDLIKATLSQASQAVLHEAGVDLPTAISTAIEAAVATAPNKTTAAPAPAAVPGTSVAS